MRTTRSDLDREQRIAVECRTCSRAEASLMSLKGGASIGIPWLLEEGIGRRSPLSEYMSLHLSLTHHRNINLFENKVWEIYLYKERRYPWCNGYRRRKWTQWHKFKSWTRLIAFHIALIPLEKEWIQLFSLQLWVNSRADWILQPWCGN